MNEPHEQELRQALDALRCRDFDSAFALFHRLATQDNALAQHFLGWMNEQGIGCEVSYSDAVHWWQLAARGGIPEAMVGLAHALENGRGAGRNTMEAYCWYLAASRLGDAEAAAAARRLEALLSKGELDAARRLIADA
ncbi:MAG TPA: hypothetical protein VJ834_04440 [Burkholderiales bacterium]|nr:hypothetical protein [Burkholderiales bacterium]